MPSRGPRESDASERCARQVACAWCGAVATPIPVHGHLQCARCGTNVDPCCGGERAEPDTPPSSCDDEP